MSNSNRTAGRNLLGAAAAVALVFAAAIPGSAHAAGACALVPDPHTPSEQILQCGDGLKVRAAEGARYRPARPQEKFQILTPLAIAAVRGTKWAMEVVPARTSTLVLSGAVAVTNRRLNQFVVLTEGQGVDITPADTSMVQKRWGEARVRALLSRFGE
jgi:hypothetical protein